MFLAGGGANSPAGLAELLAMDRTTVTALLKALSRRALVEPAEMAGDRRVRRVAITQEGRALLGRALPIWRAEHASLEAAAGSAPEGRSFLAALAGAPLTSAPVPAP